MTQLRRMRQGPHTSCENCGAEFVSEEELINHRRLMHLAAADALRCSFCSEHLADVVQLERHLSHDHGVDVAEVVPCGECGLVLAGPDALEEHMDQEHARRAGMGQGP